MRRAFFFYHPCVAAIAIALTVLSPMTFSYADSSQPLDAALIRQKMQKVIDFLDSANYAKIVSWEEHVVLVYKLSENIEPSLLKFALLKKLHKYPGLKPSAALSIALRGKEKRPSWQQCRTFLNQHTISDFQVNQEIRKNAQQLNTEPFQKVFEMLPKTGEISQLNYPSTQQFQSKTAVAYEQYNTYFGYLHAHSNLSDGEGSPLEAYTYAREQGGLDFFALTDHGEYLDLWPWDDNWEELVEAAQNTYESGKYVTLWGFEWSNPLLGHINVLNTDDFTDTIFQYSIHDIYDWIVKRPNSFGRFNHPGEYDDTDSEFSHLDLYPNAIRQMVGIETWNYNDSFDTYYYAGSWSSSFSYLDEGNRKGWYLGALGGQDNHSFDWGTLNDFRTAVLAKALTREDIIDAYMNRRFYATEDKDLHLDFRCQGYPMGAQLSGVRSIFEIRAWDGSGDTFREVRLYRNGELLKTKSVSGNDIKINFDDRSSKIASAYYYVILQQNDDNDGNGRNDEAISSPIWITSPDVSRDTPWIPLLLLD